MKRAGKAETNECIIQTAFLPREIVIRKSKTSVVTSLRKFADERSDIRFSDDRRSMRELSWRQDEAHLRN
jgi:hypothetical protein